MAEQLKKHNVRREMFAIPGAGHGLTGGDRPAVDKAMTRAREFIKGTLGAPPAAGGSEAGQAKPAAAPPIKTETSRQ
jgi:hypothetical protein